MNDTSRVIHFVVCHQTHQTMIRRHPHICTWRNWVLSFGNKKKAVAILKVVASILRTCTTIYIFIYIYIYYIWLDRYINNVTMHTSNPTPSKIQTKATKEETKKWVGCNFWTRTYVVQLWNQRFIDWMIRSERAIGECTFKLIVK